MKTAKWTMVHAFHWAVLYGAFAANLEGAMYVLKFWVWAAAALCLVLLTDSAIKSTAEKPEEAKLKQALSLAQAWVTLGLLIWFGHIASAVAWGWVMCAVAFHRDAARKLKTSGATAAA